MVFGFHNGLRFAWVQWSALAQNGALIRLSLRAMILGHALKALLMWLAHSRQRVQRQQRFRQAASKLRYWPQHHAIRGWRTRSDLQRARTELMAAIAHGLRQPTLRRGLTTWCAFVDDRIQQLARVRFATRRLAQPRQLHALLTWRNEAHVLSLCRRQKRGAIGSLRHGGSARRAYNSWLTRSHTLRRARAMLATALAALSRRNLRRATTSWIALALSQGRMAVAVAVLRHRSLRRAWMTLGSGLLDAAEANQWADSIDIRLMCLVLPSERGLEHAMSRWHTAVRRYALLRRSAMRLHAWQSGRALACWLHMRFEKRITGRALAKMRRLRSWRALSSWRQRYTAERDVRAHLCKVASKWVAPAGLVRAWRQWGAASVVFAELSTASVQLISYVYFRHAARALVQWQHLTVEQCMRRMGVSGMLWSMWRRGFNTWRQRAAAEAASWRALNRAQRVLASGPRVRAAFHTWTRTPAGHASSALRRTGLHTRVLVNQGVGFGRAFHTWVIEAESRLKLKAAVSCLVTRRSGDALRTWRSWHVVHARSLAMVRRALARATRTAEGRAWEQWCSAVVAIMPLKLVRRRADNYLHRRQMARAWCGWQVVSAAIGALHAVRTRLERVVFHREASRAFASWFALAVGRAHATRQTERVVRRLAPRTRALGRALASWVVWTEATKHLGHLITLTMARLLDLAVARAWTAWCETAVGSGMQRRASGRAASHWLSAGMGVALDTWRHASDDLRRIRRVVLALSYRSLWRAMGTWRMHAFLAVAEIRATGLREAILARRTQQRCIASFSWWRATGYLDGLAQVALTRLVQRDVRRGWRLWRSWHAALLGQLALLRAAINAMRHRRLHESFSHLRTIGASSQRLMRLSRATAALVGGYQAMMLAPNPPGTEDTGGDAGRALLARVVRAWARWSLDWRSHLKRHAVAARGSLRGVSHLLTPEERATWPRVWKQHNGWANDDMTWREASAWLVDIGVTIPNVSSSGRPDGTGLRGGVGGPAIANSPAASRLLAACRHGLVYSDLLARVVQVRTQVRHEADAGDPSLVSSPVGHTTAARDAIAMAAPPAPTTLRESNGWSPVARHTPIKTPPRRPPTIPLPAKSRTPTSEWQLSDGRLSKGARYCLRDDESSWRERLEGFFRSTDAFETLGTSSRLMIIGDRGGRAVEHLAALSALRVVIDMSDPHQWARFVASLAAEHLNTPRRVRLPCFTGPHPRDDRSACALGRSARAFVCLGCPKPRILHENEVCGRCDFRATTPIEEYVSVSAVPSGAFSYVVGAGGDTRALVHAWEA